MSPDSYLKLENEMRSVFGIDGRGLKWKANRLSELLVECPKEVYLMCLKLGENTKKENKGEAK